MKNNTYLLFKFILSYILVFYTTNSYSYENSNTAFSIIQTSINNYTIQGKTIDKKTGETIPFCSITLDGTQTGTSSNELGEFEIKVDTLPAKLVFHHVSYQKQFVIITDSKKEIVVQLSPLVNILDEVVIENSKNKTDLHAINLAKKAFKKLHFLSLSKKKFGKAFYRQKTKSDNTYTEFSEIIFDIRYDLNGINNWGILEGRYALKEASINNKNFTRLSQILKSFQPDTDDLIFPLHKKLEEFYDVRIVDVFKDKNDRITVLSFKPYKYIKTPIFIGEAYINSTTDELLKISGTIVKDDFEFIKFTDKNAHKENYELSFDITFKKTTNEEVVIDYIKVDQTFDYFKDEKILTKITTTSNLTFFEYYTPTSRKKLGGQFNQNDSDWQKLNKIAYNKEFWENNPIVKRTPVEKEVIAAFEQNNAFESIFINSRNQISSLQTKLSDDPFILNFDKLTRKFNSYNPTEKVYLHTDKNNLFAGDSLRFSVYVTLGSFLNYSQASYTLEVELVDKNQTIVAAQTLLLDKGTSNGVINISEKIPEGNYQLRAYTNWMRNFDSEFFYKKNIKISSKYIVAKKEITNNKIDLQFFPEGGNAVANLLGRVAFKAIGNDGFGREIKGKVFDSKRKQVASIQSNKDGVGVFNFKPVSGESYHVELSDKSTYPLTKISNIGYTMLVNNLNIETIKVRIQASQILKGSYFYLIGQMQNAKYFQGRYLFDNKPFVNIEIPKNKVPSGILTLTLFDKDMKPWAERLVFINNQNELIINTSFDESKLLEKGEVSVNINVTDPEGKPIETNLSVALTDLNKTQKDNNSSNILSYFLLESDLKGHIENPNQYFKDEERATAYNLDFVMLTNGWRRFNWQKIKNNQFDSIKKHSFLKGINITGIVKNKQNKILANTSINMIAKSKSGVSIHRATTKSDGSFKIDDIFHVGKTQIAFNGFNANRKPIDINVTLKKQLKSGYNLAMTPHHNEISQNGAKIILTKNQITNLQDLNFDDSTLLNEVEIKGRVTRKKASRSAYNLKPDETVFMKENDEDFVQVLNRSAGLTVIGSGRSARVSIRGFGSPLWVLDGVPLNPHVPHPKKTATANPIPSPTMDVAGPVPDVIANLDTDNIERMEILKGGKAAIYGARGNNGVILIYTKNGSNTYQRISSPEFTVTGLIEKREYYKPKFQVNQKTKVNTSTLYWNPNIRTDKNGNATFKFINNTNQIQLSIEGLSKYGNPGVYLKSFK